MSNAIKFTEKGGVSLTTDYIDEVLTLVVEDTGTGGDVEEEQHQAFVAFERLSKCRRKGGVWLGLSIVHNIVTMLQLPIQFGIYSVSRHCYP
ncbi:ATP-binding protein [Parabacteroides goldsteinii]|uniref:sensor histidine kinase n=1 Tax=Parabacteroides goldsteinii TaxID=328812 RepID=UPI002166B099|nr:ATP-binding protein [Parabacteroides goldsteinii]MCS2429323.1 ATP-binding protein [Parabacteroides goldsteinii]